MIKQLKMLYDLLKLTEKQTMRYCKEFLSYFYDKQNIIYDSNFLYAKGDIPILFVAHADTVYTKPPKEFYHDQEKQVIWSPDGLGADDRAGIFAILTLVKMGYKPSIAICTQEETGGIGAYMMISKYPTPPSDFNFIIELDRAGAYEAVFYNCSNLEFADMITKYGFEINIGTFSDISIIAPFWKIAAVNLSIGYDEEHSVAERLNYRVMFNTINILRCILDDTKAGKHNKPYEYVTNTTSFFTHQDTKHCYFCGKQVDDLYMLGAWVEPTCDYVSVCPDCIDKVQWCDNCQQPFINEKQNNLCEFCK